MPVWACVCAAIFVALLFFYMARIGTQNELPKYADMWTDFNPKTQHTRWRKEEREGGSQSKPEHTDEAGMTTTQRRRDEDLRIA